MVRMNAVRLVGVGFLVLAIGCAMVPVALTLSPDFQAVKVVMPPWSEVPTQRDTQNLLQKSEIRFLNEIEGPESIAFDPQGRGPYTGLADGRVVFYNGKSWTDFAFTSPKYWSEGCDTRPSSTFVATEHICGRPLGIRFHKKTGDMYICDAYFGLLKVGPEGGLATPLVTQVEGVPLKFTNDLDIDDDGTVYFIESSAKYEKREFMELIFSGDDSGKLMKYDPVTKKTTVLVRYLQFGNGITLSKDRSFFVFAVLSTNQLMKYYIKGEKAGTYEQMAVLHGYPDNVRTNEHGEFWIALHSHRTMLSYICGLFPRLRTFLLNLPIPVGTQFLYYLGPDQGLIVKYGPDGKFLWILEDTEGKVMSGSSEVEEKDGKLWIGSLTKKYIAVYELEK